MLQDNAPQGLLFSRFLYLACSQKGSLSEILAQCQYSTYMGKQWWGQQQWWRLWQKTHTHTHTHTPSRIQIHSPRIWAVKDHKHLRQHVYCFLIYKIWLVNVTFGRQIEMPIVSLYWPSFSGLAWTFQLPPTHRPAYGMLGQSPIYF